MASESEQFAIVEFTNTTEADLEVSVTDPSGATHVIATLAAGASTRQVSPAGASWAVANAGGTSADAADDEVPDAAKGPGMQLR